MSAFDQFAAQSRTLRASLSSDPHRPRYHFQPPAHWMNDPNGLVQWNGQYHLFYQHNPEGAWHERVHWGHAVSDDLVHWRDLPIALTPTPGGIDAGGCWSGCAVDLGDRVQLFYTGVHPQVVATATSNAPLLQTWEKEPTAVIKAPPPDVDAGDPCDFRDPYVWRERDGWYMVMGSRRVGGGGLALLYRSHDLREWSYLHPLLEGDPAQQEPFWPGTMWECPNFFSLNDTAILLVSIQNKETGELLFPAYYAGRLNGRRLIPQHSEQIDHGGSFYAPLTMRDDQDRMLMWGWLRENRSAEAARDAGWSGVMSLPRELFLHEDGVVGQRPVPELTALRSERWQYPQEALDTELNPLAEVSGSQLELRLIWEPSAESDLDLAVRCSPDGEERTHIRYDAATERLSVDRTRSSRSTDGTKDVRSAPLPLDGQPLELHIFLDGSVVETFANERICFASRIYADEESTGLSLTGHGGRIRDLSVWQLDID